jgi:hypothetical protein
VKYLTFSTFTSVASRTKEGVDHNFQKAYFCSSSHPSFYPQYILNMTTTEGLPYQYLVESTAAGIHNHMVASSKHYTNRSMLLQDLVRFQQQNAQLQPFASVSISSITSMLDNSPQTKKRESNIALHNGAAKSIFSAGEATNTNTVEQGPGGSFRWHHSCALSSTRSAQGSYLQGKLYMLCVEMG